MKTNPVIETRAGDDFPDWLSPILVKELRQGLRTKVFTSTFLLLQLLLVLCVLIGLLVAANGGNTSASTGFFWTIVSLLMLIILPWSGLNTVSGEVKANTIELIFLTRLSARRILVGKWIAIVAQSALLLAAVLPYVVLRYFMGAVALTSELLVVGLMFLASAIMSAIFVGLSAYPGRLMRVAVIIGLILSLQTVLPIILIFTVGSGSSFGGGGMGGWGFTALIVVLVLFAILILEFGAARIAPTVENHALSKRLLGLVILLVAVAAKYLDSHSQAVAVVALVAVAPVLIGAMCEETSTTLGTYRRFAKMGLLGRVLGRLLYPGWATGLLYCLLLLGGFLWLFHTEFSRSEWWQSVLLVSLGGTLFVPAAVIRLFAPGTRRALMFFIIAQAVSALLVVVVRIIEQVTSGSYALWISFIPTCVLVALGTQGLHEEDADALLGITGGVLLLGLLVLAVRSGRCFRRIAELERQSLGGADSREQVA